MDLHLANLPNALMALVPLLLNLGVFAYAWRKLTLDAQNVVFLLFVSALASWQAFDLSMRLAADVDTARLLRGLFRPGQIVAVSVGLHFILLYVGWRRLARSAWVLAFLYLPPLWQIGMFMSGTPMETLVQRPGWGWTSNVQTMHPAYEGYLVYGAVLAVVCLTVMTTRLVQVRDDPAERRRVGVLTAGVAFMVLVGGALEAVLPLLGIPQWPVASSTGLAFSGAVLYGQSRLRLFEVSTPAAAEAVVEAMTDGLFIADSGGALLFANDEARRRFGLDPRRIRTYRLHPLVVGETLDPVWTSTLQGRRHRAVDVEMCLEDGSVEAFLLSLAPIRLNRAGDLGVAVVAHDIGRLKAYEAALEEARDEALAANRSKSDFLASMSHELRTPLNVIIGYAEMLEEELDDPSTQDDLQRIERSGRHLLKLIDDILDLSKVEAGRLEARPEVVEPEALVADLASALEQLAGKRGNRLVLDVEGARAFWADPIRVRQVVLNLVSNAARFCEAGTLTVRLHDADDGAGVWIDVIDTGIGMTDAAASRLFERFTQVHASDHAAYGGTGIGLALSRHLCELMDGSLVLLQSAPGEGSVFRATLPRAQPAPTGDSGL